MKKRSKQWKEFSQLIEIVDIKIVKQQRKLAKLKKELEEIQLKIDEKWKEIDQEQQKLKHLKIKEEEHALTRFFMRRENIKSNIESLFFDVSVAKQDEEELISHISSTESEKRRLEKRKDALDELRDKLEGV